MKLKSFVYPGTLSAQMLAFAVGLLLSIGSLNADSFGRIVSFGDSLADTGNVFDVVFNASGGTELFPPPPYYDGRFSNGPVWTEYLAQDLEAPLTPYAFGGAFTSDINLFDFRGLPGLPGLTDQVGLYLYHMNYSVPEGDLITIVAGANDFFGYNDGYPVKFPIPSAHDTIANVQLLVQSGARNIIVMGIPDLSSTPEYLIGPGTALPKNELKQLKEWVATHNRLLEKHLRNMARSYGVNIIYVDVYAELNAIIASPADYGITNATMPGLWVLMQSPPAYFANTFLFWDGVHPTTTGHRLLANAVYEALVDHYGDACED